MNQDQPTQDSTAETTDPALPTLSEVEALVSGLVDVMNAGKVTELDLSVGFITLRLRAPRSESDPQSSSLPITDHASGALPDHAPIPPGLLIKAPMIGTFYSAPSPSSPQYVHVGDVIAAGQVIGIIEAMKIMNEITSDHDGIVAALLVDNGEPVEYGTPLVRLDPSGPSRR